MRQIASSGSVKAFYINNNKLISKLKEIVFEAKTIFPEIQEIWLFGSLAKGETTGMSDIDLLIIAETQISNPIERIKPYYNYITEQIDIAVDIIVAKPEEKEFHQYILDSAIQL